MSATRIVLVLSLVVVLAACGGTSGALMDDDSYAAGDGATDGASGSGYGDDGYADGSEFADEYGQGPGGILENRVIYFAFDKSDVDPEYLDILNAHGEYLASNSSVVVRLDGHTDERGSREYNIGLGEQRAQAVRQLLLLQGVSAEQMNTVSYGEERPATLGSEEEAWSLNRRVELVYSD
jgi:peptidoglycan-associated lipoprotein